MRRRDVIKGLFGTALLATGGCETAGNIDSAEEYVQSRSAGDDTLVFGRLRWIENGSERTVQNDIFGWSVSPRLKRLEDRRVFNTEIDAGGAFLWDLAPGTYIIDRINYRDPMTGNYLLVPKVAFVVPRTESAVYVGTLRADVVTSRDLLGVSGAARFSVENRLDADRRHAEAQIGAGLSPTMQSLMVQDDRLPDSIDTTPEFNMAVTLLGGLL